MKICETNAVTKVASAARDGRFTGRTSSNSGTKAIQPSAPRSRGGKLAQSNRPDSPAVTHVRRDEVGAWTERAARIIERTVGSVEAGGIDVERGRVRGVVCKVSAPVPGFIRVRSLDRSVR